MLSAGQQDLHFCVPKGRPVRDQNTACGLPTNQNPWTQNLVHVTCEDCINSADAFETARKATGLSHYNALETNRITANISFGKYLLEGRPRVGGTSVSISELLHQIALRADFDEVMEVVGLDDETISRVVSDLAGLFDCDWVKIRGEERE